MDKYKNKLEYSFGPGDVIKGEKPKEFMIWKDMLRYADKYKEVNYGVWFDLKK